MSKELETVLFEVIELGNLTQKEFDEGKERVLHAGLYSVKVQFGPAIYILVLRVYERRPNTSYVHPGFKDLVDKAEYVYDTKSKFEATRRYLDEIDFYRAHGRWLDAEESTTGEIDFRARALGRELINILGRRAVAERLTLAEQERVVDASRWLNPRGGSHGE